MREKAHSHLQRRLKALCLKEKKQLCAILAANLQHVNSTLNIYVCALDFTHLIWDLCGIFILFYLH